MLDLDVDWIASRFEAAAQVEPAARHLAEVYRTGTMCRLNGTEQRLDNTSLSFRQGLVLWHLVRQTRPKLVVETGFGRGGSAAFLLCALAPWKGRLMSIDPAFRHWAGEVGIAYVRSMGLSRSHELIERRSEFALAALIERQRDTRLRMSYIDGSHHFDGTLIDFVYLDRLTEVGGFIAIDDANSPAVRTVASFVAHNLPYRLHYPFQRLVVCEKLANDRRDWCHFKPFVCSDRSDWDVHEDWPSQAVVPGAIFGKG